MLLADGGESRGGEPSPFAGARLWVDPASTVAREAARLSRSRPGDAALLRRIARQPQALWLGDWLRDVRGAARRRVQLSARAGALPLLVAYNVPGRDCGGHSAGGARSTRAYVRWIRALAAGVGDRPAVVVLEPDALAGLDCLSLRRRRARVALLARAVRVLERRPRVAVYIDAGHSRWQPAAVIARRLRAVGVARAQGFALNVSNHLRTGEQVAYGKRVSAAIGGRHFVIDTSRNGRGPAPRLETCNAPGRALGSPPTTGSTPDRLVDALLWVKPPGESDGRCRGGPRAGGWWRALALGLARRAAG